MATSPDLPASPADPSTAEPGPVSAVATAEPQAAETVSDRPVFQVRLENFTGPFDLLLTLINKRQLDVTEVALAQVTDEFVAYIRGQDQWELDEASEFLLIAATLLDLKAARLLPRGEVEDAEDLELLEARDLLFARLLQYRAFKQVSELFGELERAAQHRYARSVSLEDPFNALLPEVLIGVSPEQFAQVAATALAPKPVPTVGLDHLHLPQVSVPRQARIVLDRLRARGKDQWVSFAELLADAPDSLHVVGRFLALLELYREQTVSFDQPEPLGGLKVAWTGTDLPSGAMGVGDLGEDYA